MTKQITEQRPEKQGAAPTATKRKTPLAGFLIAGASLAMLFGIAALKGRVKDDTK
jgi:hypothetical protein